MKTLPAPETRPEIAPFEITFSESGKAVRTDGHASILEIAEGLGIPIATGCRGGGCGRCKVHCLDGKVFMRSHSGLEREELEQGYVLSCVGCPRGHVVIRA